MSARKAPDSVLIVDDHELSGSALELMLDELGVDARHCRVTTTAQILQTIDRVDPAVVLLDLDLGVGPKDVPIDALTPHPRLADQQPRRPGGLRDHRSATSRGGRGGGRHRDRREDCADRGARDRRRRLTPREREILERLARGERAVTIAAELVVSVATVRWHIQKILIKIEVNSQLEAAALLRPVKDLEIGATRRTSAGRRPGAGDR